MSRTEKQGKTMDMNILLWMLFVLMMPRETASQTMDCFSEFNSHLGTCGLYLGKVSLDDCCLNPHYGYTEDNGMCQSCGPAVWSQWSPWGPCTVTCHEGVSQRKRSCQGIGKCTDAEGLGKLQSRPCEEQTCCPQEGGWSAWSQWLPCSVTCGTGSRRRTRSCSQPPPRCGGGCQGLGVEAETCETQQVCPVHGGWSEWGAWGQCAKSCVTEGLPSPLRQRTRNCNNPQPSTHPQGRPCPEMPVENERCTRLPNCPVPGGWGEWTAISACSVTCGVGLKRMQRQCDSPAPQHGGRPCDGESITQELCNKQIHCPVDGQWSEWEPWEPCKRSGKEIRCKTTSAGTQRRTRNCLFMDWDGKQCANSFVESRVCYDIEGCKFYGNWSEWSEWGLCKPSCGPGAQKTRTRQCELDLSQYSKYIGRNKEEAHFSGKPLKLCSRNTETVQNAPCRNVPACEDS